MQNYKYRKIIFLILYILSFQVLYANPTQDIQIHPWQTYQIPEEGEVLIDIALEIPEGHYIYLKHLSPKGYSILTEFTIDESKGLSLKEVIKPKGEKVKEDMVLRGRGVFSLKITNEKARKKGEKLSLEYTIITQMCNEKNGVCYAPYTFEKKLNLIFVENNMPPVRTSRTTRAGGIKWIEKHPKGVQSARAAGKNMFVLITAPTWCGPCQYLDATTLKDQKVINFLNTNFIPVKIRDIIDGERNPDLWIYDFEGFPTYMIVTPEKEILYSDAGTISAESLLNKIIEFEYSGSAEPEIDEINEVETGFLYADNLSYLIETGVRVQAAFLFEPQTGCAILNDGTFVLYDIQEDTILKGYPRSIDSGWPGLKPYKNRIAGATDYENGKYYIFLTDGSYLRFSPGEFNLHKGYPKKITSISWKGVESYRTKIKGAVYWKRNGKTYFFLNDGRYLRFDNSREAVDRGYPMNISDQTWPGMEDYGKNISAVINDGMGFSYFFLEGIRIIKYDNNKDRVIE